MMNDTKWRLCLPVLASLLLAGNAAQAKDDEVDPKDWQEQVRVAFPAAPQAEQLIAFYVSPTATQSFALDAASLTINADGVIRYTVVGKSASGVRNVSYEGIRCATFETKTYGYGRADGGWTAARSDQWRRIAHTISNRVQGALAQDFFCEGDAITGKVPEILQKMRQQTVK